MMPSLRIYVSKILWQVLGEKAVTYALKSFTGERGFGSWVYPLGQCTSWVKKLRELAYT